MDGVIVPVAERVFAFDLDWDVASRPSVVAFVVELVAEGSAVEDVESFRERVGNVVVAGALVEVVAVAAAAVVVDFVVAAAASEDPASSDISKQTCRQSNEDGHTG